MRRRALTIGGIIVGVIALVLIVLAVLVWHEPKFYHAKSVPPGPRRTALSKEFEQTFSTFVSEIYNKSPIWHATFSEEQINSYFEERFVQSGVAGTMLPEGVSSPRISIENDGVVRIGFQYGNSPWSTTASITLRVWMTPKERNVVGVQIMEMRAGLIPISSKLLTDQLEQLVQGRDRDVDVTWYRHEGDMVALLRFEASRPHPSRQLQQLKVGNGKIIIAGRSLEAYPPVIPTTPPEQTKKHDHLPVKPASFVKPTEHSSHGRSSSTGQAKPPPVPQTDEEPESLKPPKEIVIPPGNPILSVTPPDIKHSPAAIPQADVPPAPPKIDNVAPPPILPRSKK